MPTETEVERVERETRTEANRQKAKAEQERVRKEINEANQALLKQFQEQETKNRANLQNKTLATINDFETLNHEEQTIIAGDIEKAYYDTALDGYGDEGAGYDSTQFTKNLIKLGWVYNPN